MNAHSVTLSRRLLLAGAIATSALLGACASTPSAQPQSLQQLVAADPALSTFNTLLQQSGVANTLQENGPYTLLAPSDEAFKALPAKTLADWTSQPEKLRALVQYHVVKGRLAAAEVKNNAKVATLQGAEFEVSKAGDFMTAENAVVTQADRAASNGLLQVLDSVMLPPVKK